jgi:hypothetical protein
MHTTRTFAAAVVGIALLLGACSVRPGTLASAPVADASPSATAAASGVSERQMQQARDALARWDAALTASGTGDVRFVPTGELSGQIGDWEAAVGENNKSALLSGLVEADGPFEATAPPSGDVRWPDGTHLELPTMTADAALAALRVGGSCPGCRPLKITDARFSTGQVRTTRGDAIVPVWEFTIAGTRVRLTRVAVAQSATPSVSPPPGDPDDPPAGVSIDSFVGSPSSADLVASVVGPREGADEPCGADFDGVAVESDHAVVVVVIVHDYAGPVPSYSMGTGAMLPAGVVCDLVGHNRTFPVHLARPLGDRTVLEGRQGLPAPVTRTLPAPRP